ncbi:MAG: hypothetical protein FWH12_07650 [Treponema sp.]|nr:hypothetical protein [Treponema sp.]
MDQNEISHDLIIAAVNHGFSDEVVASAREAGVSGGTVISARAHAHEEAVAQFGVPIEEEKDIILMLVERDKKYSIMQIITEKHGLNTNANGIVYSLPVDMLGGMSPGNE